LHYYEAVANLDPNIHDFYRLFLAPGVNHCFGGNGAFPDTTFDALREWVEDDVAPDSLSATSVGTSPTIQRKLCPYPKRQVYDGTGNASTGEGYSCVGCSRMVGEYTLSRQQSGLIF
jgi:feruloyl esterase